MTDDLDRPGTKKHKWFWTIGLVLLAVAVSFWFARPLGESTTREAVKPQPQSTEWAPEPEGKAVPVDLPTTPLKNVAEEHADDQGKAESKEN